MTSYYVSGIVLWYRVLHPIQRISRHQIFSTAIISELGNLTVYNTLHDRVTTTKIKRKTLALLVGVRDKRLTTRLTQKVLIKISRIRPNLLLEPVISVNHTLIEPDSQIVGVHDDNNV